MANTSTSECGEGLVKLLDQFLGEIDCVASFNCRSCAAARVINHSFSQIINKLL